MNKYLGRSEGWPNVDAATSQWSARPAQDGIRYVLFTSIVHYLSILQVFHCKTCVHSYISIHKTISATIFNTPTTLVSLYLMVICLPRCFI